MDGRTILFGNKRWGEGPRGAQKTVLTFIEGGRRGRGVSLRGELMGRTRRGKDREGGKESGYIQKKRPKA